MRALPVGCLIVSLVYIERLVATSEVPILCTSWRPILLAGLILAQKVWDDRSLHNVDFSFFCPMFTLKEIATSRKVPRADRLASRLVVAVRRRPAPRKSAQFLGAIRPAIRRDSSDAPPLLAPSTAATPVLPAAHALQRENREFHLKPMDVETAAKPSARHRVRPEVCKGGGEDVASATTSTRRRRRSPRWRSATGRGARRPGRRHRRPLRGGGTL